MLKPICRFTGRHRLLEEDRIEDLRLAASKLKGAARRAFMAEMTLKYCDGRARLAEAVFGWGRETVEVGLAEKRTGLECVGAQAGFCGGKRWEEQYPQAAAALCGLAEAHAQQDPSFQTTLAYTRLTSQGGVRGTAQGRFCPRAGAGAGDDGQDSQPLGVSIA